MTVRLKNLADWLAHQGQDQLVRFFVTASVVGHLIFFILNQLGLQFRIPEPLVEEWTMDTDLLTESDLSNAPSVTTIPGAKVEEKAQVPDNLLPQLPKQFTLQETTKEKAEELVPGPDEKKETKEEEPEKKAKEAESETKADEEIQNRLDKADALKRLALERLKKQQTEKNRELKAPSNEKLARIGDELEKSDKLSGVAGGAAGFDKNRYRKVLYSAVHKNYHLPETFKLVDPNITVVIAIRVNGRGELMAVEVEQSSNDPVFDEAAINAAKNSAPFDPPPSSLAGEIILLQFKP